VNKTPGTSQNSDLKIGEFDMERMVAALAEPSIVVPHGLTREQTRTFILTGQVPPAEV
jgi:hypothetical protein